jgi:ubiquinone/menaquinone biosynthesis C-methylase UbiE
MKIHRGNFESNLLFLEKSGIINKQMTILEIGSGTGALVKHLQNEGYNIIGTEVNHEYISFAQKEFGIDLVPLKNYQLPFPDESFDVILSFDVFEHIPDTDAHLKEVYRVLKKEGCYLLATPNKITNIPFEIIKEKSFTKYKTYHPSLHTFPEIKKRFKKHGFEIKFEKIPLVNDFFKEKIKKYFGNFGLIALKIINPDALPLAFKTNFYITATKK